MSQSCRIHGFVLLSSLMIFVAAAGGARAQEEDEDALAELANLEQNVLRGRASAIRIDLEDYLFDFPDSVRARLLDAEVQRRRGQDQRSLDAILAIEEAAIEAGLAERWALQAFEALRQRGRFEEAGAALEKALADQPSSTALRVCRIQLLALKGERAAARRQLRELPAVKMDETGDPALLLEHARAYAALGIADPGDRCAVFAEALFRKARDPRQAQALEVLGDIYRLARFEDGLPALRAYHDALEIDGTAVLCHVGTARVHIYRMSFDKARAAVEAALSLQPNHAGVRAAEAELILFDRKFSEGRDAAEKALERHPRHLPLLACRAAAKWLLSEDDREAAVEAFLAVDPGYADGLRLMGDIVSYHYRFAEAIPLYERGLEVDPNHSVTYVGMARSLANTGRGEEALEALRSFRAIDRDRYPLANNLRKSLEAVSGFVTLERGPFDLHLHAGDAPVLGPLLWKLYERKWADLCERYSLDPDRDIRVEVFHEHNAFSARSVGFTGFGALGVCFGDTFTIVSPSSELRGTFHWERTAVHEMVHVASLALSNQRVPRWLTEGMSVYEEKVFASHCDREMDQELLDYYSSGDLFTIREFNSAFAGPKILFGYFQGGLLCEYLVETWGHDVLSEMLRGFARDWESPQVVQEVLGMSPEDLDQRFREWLWETRISKMKVQPTYTPEGRRRLLARVRAAEDPAAEDLVQLAWAYHRAGRRVDRNDYLARSREKDPSLPSLEFLLAEIAMEEADVDAALAHLRSGVEAGGEEFYAFRRLAELAISRGEKERALEWYGRAKDCFARFVGAGNPYVQRAQLLSELGREDEVLDELRQYCAIQESDMGARWSLAQQALDRDDFAEAEKYLLELRAIDPFQRRLHRALARCQRELARPSEAEFSLQLALAVAPQDEPDHDASVPAELLRDRDASERAELQLDLCELYRSIGEDDKAAAALESARELNPESERLSELSGAGPSDDG